MITFNTVLRHERIDPGGVLLVRHQTGRGPDGQTPYSLWRATPERFELYQRVQSKDRFPVGTMLASFVVTPASDTLFVGLYQVSGRGMAPAGLIDPISGKDDGGLHFYDIVLDERLSEYRGLLVIDWGQGFRTWLQKAARQDKPIVEVRKVAFDPPFPGFTKFRHDIDIIETIPEGWKEVLRSVKGVYVLVCKETGKLYVGSAMGTDSLWGRFVQYATDGHGGNIELKRRGRKPYQVSVLEIVNSGEGIESLEEAWKQKLMSRRFGLNDPIAVPSVDALSGVSVAKEHKDL